MSTKKLTLAKKKNPEYKLYFALAAITFIVVTALVIINSRAPVNHYLKELKVEKATVLLSSSENGSKYYIMLSLPGSYNISSDNQWIEVNQDFYRRNGNMGSTVGVLLGNYDTYKDNPWGKGQKFTNSGWTIEDVYDSVEAAQIANPHKIYTAPATVSKKKIGKDGKAYFVLTAEGRTISTPVDKVTYDKYNIGQEVETEFEAIGESVKFLRVIK